MDQLALHDVDRQGATWPNESLDVDGLMRAGWRPLPLRQFVLKVHSRCNLRCDYCYVYRSPDQSWRSQPTRMSRATVVEAARRIGQHVRVHALPQVEVVLHGGEPLLAGPQHLAFVAETVRSAVPKGVAVDLSLQTNAVLLDQPLLDTLGEHDVRVGVSLDGTAATHDIHRTLAGGRGTHGDVERGLRLLTAPPYHQLFAGFLCVVDLQADPVATYEQLIEYRPPTIDFLLPLANWSDPPPRRRTSSAPYGAWLIAAFERWYGAEELETHVRLFDETIRGLLGRPSRSESIGLAPARLAVVETDGSIEHVDTLKSTYDGAAFTGLHVRRDPFDAMLLSPHLVARQIGTAALADTCRRCDVRTVCGGGYYPHRYHRATGFRNPSVYCDDLAAFIHHVYRRVRADLGRSGRPHPE